MTLAYLFEAQNLSLDSWTAATAQLQGFKAALIHDEGHRRVALEGQPVGPIPIENGRPGPGELISVAENDTPSQALLCSIMS